MGQQLPLFPELAEDLEHEGTVCEPMLERMQREATKPGGFPWWLRKKRRRMADPKQEKLPGVKRARTRSPT